MITKRADMLADVGECDWDVVIIGGGATGLGAAVDAANRGLKTVLLEQSDFAKSTSSRSTKLVHGGVRYLQQGDVFLVREALHERGLMRQNAPHLVSDMRFVIGQYRWWEKIFYTVGLTFYDILAGSLGFGRSVPLSKKEVLSEIPGLERSRLMGGVAYHDGQFDDARMAVTLALSAQDAGARVLNYVKVVSLIKNSRKKVCGVRAVDVLDPSKTFDIRGKAVINATGIFVDEIMILDAPEDSRKVRPSQGVHLVVDASFLGGKSALMIPKTDDGRVLFGVPWHGRAILGTTDTPLEEFTLEPRALVNEVDFILGQAGKYLSKKPERKDVLCVFAGLRPLAAPQHSGSKKTKEISRSHKIYKSASGLLSITGGKWTTYRAMAEDVVNKAVSSAKLAAADCQTEDLKLHGYMEDVDRSGWDYVYGTDMFKIRKIAETEAGASDKIHPNYPFKKAHVIFAARNEFAQTVDDVLARRVRLLFLDARAALECAPTVAEILKVELGKDDAWKEAQVRGFMELAKGYILS